MRAEEKSKPAFVRPKRWFKRGDYKRVIKQKVFGMTTSNGQCLAVLLPKPFTAAKWVGRLRTRVAPFLQKQFPAEQHYRILLDGEAVLRAEVAEAVMAEKRIKLLGDWPKYSPDLNRRKTSGQQQRAASVRRRKTATPSLFFRSVASRPRVELVNSHNCEHIMALHYLHCRKMNAGNGRRQSPTTQAPTSSWRPWRSGCGRSSTRMAPWSTIEWRPRVRSDDSFPGNCLRTRVCDCLNCFTRARTWCMLFGKYKSVA